MSEKRFSIEKCSGKYIHLPIFDNGKEISDNEVCELLNKQESIINLLFRELDQAIKMGYVLECTHRNHRCNIIPFKDDCKEHKVK